MNQLVRSWSLPHELLTGAATLYSLAMTCFYEIVYNRNKKNKKAIDSHLLLNIHFSYTPWDKNRNWEYCTWNFGCCVYRIQSVHRCVWKDNDCNNNNHLLVICIYIYIYIKAEASTRCCHVRQKAYLKNWHVWSLHLKNRTVQWVRHLFRQTRTCH